MACRGCRRRGRALKKRYGRAFPLVAVGLAKIATLAKAAHVIEPLERLAVGGWAIMSGGKKKKRKS
jgi:hypothetical protein